MNHQLTVTREFHVTRRKFGQKQYHDGVAHEASSGRIPRIARLMALAIRCEKLIRDGVVADQSELARFGQITTARMTQVMVLLNLAPDIQEKVLFLPRTEHGRDAVKETDIRPIASTLDWRKQRRMWAALQQRIRGDEASSRSVVSAPRTQRGC
jgi:hypothetical protein